MERDRWPEFSRVPGTIPGPTRRDSRSPTAAGDRPPESVSTLGYAGTPPPVTRAAWGFSPGCHKGGIGPF